MPLSLGTSLGNARLGISTKWPKGISLGANIPLGVDPKKAMSALKLRSNHDMPDRIHMKSVGSSINRMMAQVKRSNLFSRPCFYRIEIGPPKALAGHWESIRDITLNCETVSFPGLNLSTKPHKIGGGLAGFEYAYERQLAPVNMSFYVSDDMQEFQFFQRWIEHIMPVDGRFNYPKGSGGYTGSIKIFQCSNRIDTDVEDLPVVMSCELTDAYPKTVGDLSLGHGLKDAIHKVPITIIYNDIKFKNYAYSNSGGVNQTIQQGADYLKNAWQSYSEVGTMLKGKFDDLGLPKLGTLIKKKSSFLPGSMDAIRGGGSSAGSAGGMHDNSSVNGLGAGSKYV